MTTVLIIAAVVVGVLALCLAGAVGLVTMTLNIGRHPVTRRRKGA